MAEQKVPRTKVVVRKLPAMLPEDKFRESLDAKFNAAIDDLFYYQGKVKTKSTRLSVAFINFTSPALAQEFLRSFQGHIYVDAKGKEDRAEVDFALNQKVPKKKRVDERAGTIQDDLEYKEFVEKLNKPSVEKLPSAEVQLEKRLQEEAALKAANNGQLPPIITPLIADLRAKKMLKMQQRELKEKKRQERLEKRRAKQRERDVRLGRAPQEGGDAFHLASSTDHTAAPATVIGPDGTVQPAPQAPRRRRERKRRGRNRGGGGGVEPGAEAPEGGGDRPGGGRGGRNRRKKTAVLDVGAVAIARKPAAAPVLAVLPAPAAVGIPYTPAQAAVPSQPDPRVAPPSVPASSYPGPAGSPGQGRRGGRPAGTGAPAAAAAGDAAAGPAAGGRGGGGGRSGRRGGRGAGPPVVEAAAGAPSAAQSRGRGGRGAPIAAAAGAGGPPR